MSLHSRSETGTKIKSLRVQTAVRFKQVKPSPGKFFARLSGQRTLPHESLFPGGIMILFEASHTSHTRAQTGVQRVVRSMYAALCQRESIEPVCFDPHQQAWRALQVWERNNLGNLTGAGSAHRSAQWPLHVRFAGYARQIFNARSACPEAKGLIAPEIFSAKVARAYPDLFTRIRGPRVAVFHDAVALRLPEYTPVKTVARFPNYLRELLAFDGVAAVSEDSRRSLVDYWRWAGIKDIPETIAIANAIGTARQLTALAETPAAPVPTPPVILSVGSIEGRKNHLALLEACEQLWAKGLVFELRLIGLAHPQTGLAALEKMRALRDAGRPLRYDGPVDDAGLATAYRECSFTVYPSLMEGFGLPVQESLAHGKPCICSSRGAIGESAIDGGCQPLDRVDSGSLAAAIEHWVVHPEAVAEATDVARKRTFKTWQVYADELVCWMRELPHRAEATANFAL
jgi:glycosyltransferase involved in cell wall biosynthesis